MLKLADQKYQAATAYVIIPRSVCGNKFQIKKYCNCDLRTIDYSAYPDHVADTQNYAWRPIILQVTYFDLHISLCSNVDNSFC